MLGPASYHEYEYSTVYAVAAAARQPIPSWTRNPSPVDRGQMPVIRAVPAPVPITPTSPETILWPTPVGASSSDLRSWFWNPRIGFSNGSDHVTSSVSIVNSISSNRISHQVTQIIETDPEDATYRFKITWSKSSSSANHPKTVNGCDNERYS